ncbi:hypothetical protein A4X09_0g6762 [Tilletia walkeri]|uniref:Protein kinase domain-containing protein n=1 Tax=Tilletia walkeri TaxID=117179 RepID=A0A8X7T1M3_9BASI|nr:hypothetical protein A4X09_0g6762 [Tilletia walkeri]
MQSSPQLARLLSSPASATTATATTTTPISSASSPTSAFGANSSSSSSSSSIITNTGRYRPHLNALEAIPSPIISASSQARHLLPTSSHPAIAASAATASNSVLAPPPTAEALASLEGPLLPEDIPAGIYGGYTTQRTLGIGAFSRVVLAVPPLPRPPHTQSLPTTSDHLHLESLSRAASYGPSTSGEDSNSSSSSSSTVTAGLQPAISLQSPLSPPLPGSSSSFHQNGNPVLSTESHLRIRTASPPSAIDGLPADSSPLPHMAGVSLSASSSASATRRLSIQTQSLDRSQMAGSACGGNGGGTAAVMRAAATAAGHGGLPQGSQQVYALKMLEREPCRTNQRMKVSWVREVEVLKHISHPSLIHLVRSFCTPTYNILVLEAVSGGELFDLVAQHHADIIAPREWLVRRLMGELANAVGWMHRVNLVHRDIKLENILLTKDLRTCQPLTPSSLPPYSPTTTQPQPLLKLTDFGLSRFIDPATPHLETRCGSEEYAAPELIMGRRYDGRKTDAWALGVVGYALLTGSLPFLEDLPGSNAGAGSGSSAGLSDASAAASGSGSEGRSTQSNQVNASVRETAAASSRGAGGGGGGGAAVLRDPRARKAHLLRIAKGDLRWPETRNMESRDEFGLLDGAGTGALTARNRLITPAAQNFVGRLLRRDAAKRANVWDVWDEAWMVEGSFGGQGAAGAGAGAGAGAEAASSSSSQAVPASASSTAASIESPAAGPLPPSSVSNGTSNPAEGRRSTETRFQRVEETSAQGELFEVPLDPRVGSGREWMDRWTTLRTEPLSAVARDD